MQTGDCGRSPPSYWWTDSRLVGWHSQQAAIFLWSLTLHNPLGHLTRYALLTTTTMFPKRYSILRPAGTGGQIST